MKKIFEIFWHRSLKRPYKLVKTIDQGEGEKIIVLIHGLASTAASWLPAIKRLSGARYRIVGYDLLGFGQSPKPDFLDYSSYDHARTLAYSLKKDFGYNNKFILIGHSMGSIIAVRLAFDNVLNIERCILYQPPLLTLAPKERRNFYRSLYSFLASRPDLVLNYSRLVKKLATRLALFTVSPDTWLAFNRSLNNTIIAQSTLMELATMRIPVDIVYGRFDFVVSRSEASRLIRANKCLRLHRVNSLHDITPQAGSYMKKLLSTPHKC